MAKKKVEISEKNPKYLLCYVRSEENIDPVIELESIEEVKETIVKFKNNAEESGNGYSYEDDDGYAVDSDSFKVYKTVEKYTVEVEVVVKTVKG